MSTNKNYAAVEPTRAEVDAFEGATVIEFGTPWCGYCRRAQPLIEEALRFRGDLRHLKIEDGSGRRLGRSFAVKLWPTLIFMNNGKEVARVVRPADAEEIRKAFAAIGPLRAGDENV